MKRPILVLSALLLSFAVGVFSRPYIRELFPSAPRIAANPRAIQFESLNGPADIVLLGDSLTDQGRWGELMDLRVANRGIDGDTVRMVAARVDELPDAPVFVMIGINDLTAGRSVEAIVADYTILLDRLRDRQVIVQSVLGPSELEVQELNLVLKDLATQRGLRFLDLSPSLGHPLKYTYDGIHLTAKGYRIWAEEIGAVVESL